MVFRETMLEVADFEEAARARNVCQAKGIAGSPTDMLMCAVALRHGWSIFTEDADFGRYAKHLPIQLHQPRK